MSLDCQADARSIRRCQQLSYVYPPLLEVLQRFPLNVVDICTAGLKSSASLLGNNASFKWPTSPLETGDYFCVWIAKDSSGVCHALF